VGPKAASIPRRETEAWRLHVKYVGRGGLVAELERNLKLADAVMKFQTVQLRAVVNMAELQIDPEEVKLQKLELQPDDDEKESREKALGLVDLGPDAPRSRVPEDDFADEEAEDDDGPATKPSDTN
jgi:small subunit ribosomal protein S6